jgi:hypothetical protein
MIGNPNLNRRRGPQGFVNAAKVEVRNVHRHSRDVIV